MSHAQMACMQRDRRCGCRSCRCIFVDVAGGRGTTAASSRQPHRAVHHHRRDRIDSNIPEELEFLIAQMTLQKADAPMPGRILQTTAAGLVLAVSLPVVTFAISTTLFALTLLSVRASVLSLDFWISVLTEAWSRSGERAQTTPTRPAIQHQPSVLEFRPAAQHSRKNSFNDASSLKRLSYRSDSNTSLAGTPLNRDFEGVGGWRHDDEDQQSLYMNMNSRLERTRSSSRHHRRSHTGSYQATALNSPELMPLRTPRARPQTSGSASPQSYFSLPLPTSRSMVSLQQKRLSGLGAESWDSDRTERLQG